MPLPPPPPLVVASSAPPLRRAAAEQEERGSPPALTARLPRTSPPALTAPSPSDLAAGYGRPPSPPQPSRRCRAVSRCRRLRGRAAAEQEERGSPPAFTAPSPSDLAAGYVRPPSPPQPSRRRRAVPRCRRLRGPCLGSRRGVIGGGCGGGASGDHRGFRQWIPSFRRCEAVDLSRRLHFVSFMFRSGTFTHDRVDTKGPNWPPDREGKEHRMSFCVGAVGQKLC